MDQVIDSLRWLIITTIAFSVFIGIAIIGTSIDSMIARQNEARRESENE